MMQLSHVWRAVPGVRARRARAVIGREEGAVQNLLAHGITLAAILRRSDFPETL